MSRPLDLVSLVVPVFNEESVLPLLLPRLTALFEELPCRAEVILVDDGSQDQSPAILAYAANCDDRFKVVELSRNFGQQMAITAGLDHAAGDVIVVLDADLQDPPEMIPKMLHEYLAGTDIVFAQRSQRHGETWLKRSSAAAFYWIMRRVACISIPANAGEFRLMSRKVVDTLGRMPERQRFTRGLAAWTGFKQMVFEFERPARTAGETKFTVRKMLALAWQGITSFSALPLRCATFVGLLLLLATGGLSIAAGVQYLHGSAAAGWLTLLAAQSGLFGLVLVALGVQGDYIARIHEEIKCRPLYVVQNSQNLEALESRQMRRRQTPEPTTNVRRQLRA